MAINPIEIIIRAKDEASGVFSSMGSKVAAVGAAIAGYFGIDAFVGAVKGAANLEAKLSEVQAVSGATTAEMVQLRKAAEDAGATTKFTATEGAEALGNLARSGLNAKDAIAALPAVLQLAQAGGIGLAEASDYVSKTVMGMGLAFTDAGRVADVMAMGANASNTSVTGLAQALSYAAPLAKTLGLDLETTVAIIGKFADAGIDASRAGTALNAIMAQFADPSSKFRTELAGAGIITNNFEQALRQLAAAGPAGSKAINAVGTEAGPALRALLNQGIGALDDLKVKLEGAAGSAAKTAAVMQNNLLGSFDSLSSAWDTVKNTLATPVLPVLKDGVEKLSKAFSDAVSSGAVAKFGESIATAFQAGIKWAQDFAAKIDFTKVAADLRAFADRAGEVFRSIGENARAAGDSAKLAYGVMSAGANGVLTVIYGVGVAFAGVAATVQKGLALLYEGFSKITFGDVSAKYKQMAADIRLSADATTAVSRAMADKAVAAFTAMGDGAQLARNGFSSLSSSSSDAAAKATPSAAAFDQVAASLSGVGNAATDAAAKASDSATRQQVTAQATKEKVAALRAEYEAAVATGNWQLATEKMQALNGAAKESKNSIADLKKQADEAAQAIADAFSRAGIKTKTELATVASVAKADFETIKGSGEATADGLREAFKKYAEAAIASNNGVATETLKSEAAMRGLAIQTDSTGKTIISAMGSGSDATQRFGGNVRNTTADIERQTEALRVLQTLADRTAAPVANKDKISKDNPYGLTSDGLKANKDGSAAGTSNNTLPIDLAYKIKNASDTGQSVNMTQAELDTAKTQAKNALNFIQEMSKLSAGSVSIQALNDAQALVNATNSGRVNVTDKPSSTQSLNSYTVNLNINGQNTPVKVASESDAQALIAALKRAQQTAGGG
jgi:TP901 family phage tail tape measure protein